MVKFKFSFRINEDDKGLKGVFKELKSLVLFKGRGWTVGVYDSMRKRIEMFLVPLYRCCPKENGFIESIIENITHEYLHSELDKIDDFPIKQEHWIIEKMGF